MTIGMEMNVIQVIVLEGEEEWEERKDGGGGEERRL